MTDPRVSATGEPLSEADLALAEQALPHASDRSTPRRPDPEVVDPVQLASWIAVIVLGRSRADAGIADGTREAELWDALAADCAAITARGDTIDVPAEWFG